MKFCKQMAAVLLALLMLPTVAFAAGSIDLNEDVKLTVSYQDEDRPLAGAGFSIYLAATVDETGELTPTDAFSRFPVDIRGKNDEAWRTLASTLEGYVLRDGIAPTDSGKTDADGHLHFPTDGRKLTPGLYLVLGSRHTQDGTRYDAMPFLVMLPTQDAEGNQWSYDVLVEPKYDAAEIPDIPAAVTRRALKVWDDAGHESSRPEEVVVQLLRDGEIYDTAALNAENNWRYTWPELAGDHIWTVTEQECAGYTVQVERDGITFVITNTPSGGTPDKPTPAEPTLPQTGQLWWPVPLLLAVGLLFVAVGLICRRRKDGKG